MRRDLFNENSKRFFTAGYEGKDIDEFIDHLSEYNIQRVVDVREIPLSRKPGFSKTALRKRLAEHGIDYIHFRTLGSPSSLRKKLYQDKDFEYFFEEYERHLETCKDELKKIYEVISERLSCLLCFEKDHSNCHRTAVADRVNQVNGTSFKVEHI
ncbi:MAG: DUF488 domain-containing protein [Candidatus Omnitrophica bacterium]|nr:DUF488 domain-containing protein [Candidatus Omnitrophota bacterium]